MLKAPTSVALSRPQLTIGLRGPDKGQEELLNMLLTDLGYTVRRPHDGGEPPEVQPDIIVTDTARALMLLKESEYAETSSRVVALYHPSDAEAARECLLAGAAEILPLPLDDRLLIVIMDKVAERVLLERQLCECTENLERMSERQAARIIELTHARRKYEHLFDQVPCYITVQDRDLRIVEANSRFLRDFGFDRGMHCFEAYKQRDCECDNCPVRRTFDDGDPHQHEAIVTSKTGQTYNILVWTAPVFNEEGDVEHVLEVSTNITAVRKLQDQLTSLGMMLGSMSHGVKGLLGALEGGIYRVDAGLERGDLERVEKGWKVVKHRVGHMKKMVLDTLYYSKSRDLLRQPVRLGDFAADAAEAVRPKAEEHGIEFDFRMSDENHLFHADPDALLPALINFLENAVDACLFDRSKARHRIAFRAGVSNNIVTFEIADNGVGMSEETRDNMFTLFFSSKGANGTGIGLFIANQVIERHNGSIKVDSAEGDGTRFRILLPSS